MHRYLSIESVDKTFETKKGGSGHLVVRRGDRKSELPMHGGRKELGTGLVNAIKKQLGVQ